MKTKALSQAMEILKVVRKITESSDLAQVKLEKVTKAIAQSFKSDSAAFYIAIDNNYLELFAAYGFKKDVNNKVSLRFGEGLVGDIAKTNRSMVVKDVLKHPKFVHIEELEDQQYKSFLGVPLVRRSRCIGVITLYSKKTREYTPLEVEIMETVALVLAELTSSEEMATFRNRIIKERGFSGRERIKGLSLNKGYGMGIAIVHHRRQMVNKIFAEDKEKELRRLNVAHAQMNEDLDEKFNATKLGIGEHTEILDAYRMFAKDKGWYKRISDNIQSGLTAEAAVERAYEDMWNRLSGTQDTYLRERLNDLRDVADRLQSYLSGDYKDPAKQVDSDDIIIVAQNLGPAELMDYDFKKVRGLIIEDGTPTMHVAIVAKALNIPVISKTRGLFEEIKTGQLLAVDGDENYVYINPSVSVQERFKVKLAEKKKLQEKLLELRNLASKTSDGTRVGMYINVGLAFDLDYIESTNCDGIGLYRTEIPFMAADAMPDVDTQTSYYKQLMDKAGNKKVIFRSLDVGSDKLLPYWSNMNEENPAIGWRSIRITLDRRAILRKQIRAFLRAAEGKELNVMFPMISDLAEFEDAKETLLIELEKEKKKTGKTPKKVNVGLMIEVPSVIFQIEDILEKADFISIGTNDLAQFMFACDRGNPKLTERYDILSSPFLKIMKYIVDKADKAGVYCSVCGEMASNPIEAMVLIGLGYRNLSASGSSFGRVKSMIRSINVSEVSEYVQSLLKSSQKSLRPQLIAYAYDHGIEIY
ncbi:MAG: phosphoenolpyruvate--protein phosphotransferase [Lactobacillus sp.]|jgi:phosphotransferase system enzyme I (PtsP)|nr:phosphoenolpyruvate--protein phosphotransferase [Lactobacillus sp.]